MTEMILEISGQVTMNNSTLKPFPLPDKPYFKRWIMFALFLIVQFLLSTGSLFAQTQEINSTPTQTPSPGELKKLSLEGLMDLDVTSVAKEPQPYG